MSARYASRARTNAGKNSIPAWLRACIVPGGNSRKSDMFKLLYIMQKNEKRAGRLVQYEASLPARHKKDSSELKSLAAKRRSTISTEKLLKRDDAPFSACVSEAK